MPEKSDEEKKTSKLILTISSVVIIAVVLFLIGLRNKMFGRVKYPWARKVNMEWELRRQMRKKAPPPRRRVLKRQASSILGVDTNVKIRGNELII